MCTVATQYTKRVAKYIKTWIFQHNVFLYLPLNITQIKTSIIIKTENYKIAKLLNNSIVSKFVTKKWVEVNDLSSGQYSINKNIRLKTSMLRSELCDYSDAYIVVKGTIMMR